jgi:hypothetical protein
MKLSDMQKDPFAVHILDKDRADTLIDAGLAQPVTLDPMPRSDIPVSLTGLGRSATETAPRPSAPATK